MSTVVASIDLGSNSFYLAYAKVENGCLSPTCRIRKRVRLGQNVAVNGCIGEDVQQRALNALKTFRQELDDIGATTVMAAGTAALRKASDSKTFLKQAQKILNCPIDVITGKQEAAYVFEGVRMRHPDLFEHDKHIVIDIGGGSTEVALGCKHQNSKLSSIHVGCLTWAHYLKQHDLSESSYHSILSRTRKFIEKDCANFRKENIHTAFGTSGCWRVLEDVRQILRIEKLNQEGLKQIETWMLGHQSLQELSQYDASIERLDILPLALALASAFMSALQIEQVHYCDANLQDGLLSLAWQSLGDKIA